MNGLHVTVMTCTMRSMATHVACSVIFRQKRGKLRDVVANETVFSHKQCTHDLKYLFLYTSYAIIRVIRLTGDFGHVLFILRLSRSGLKPVASFFKYILAFISHIRC